LGGVPYFHLDRNATGAGGICANYRKKKRKKRGDMERKGENEGRKKGRLVYENDLAENIFA